MGRRVASKRRDSLFLVDTEAKSVAKDGKTRARATAAVKGQPERLTLNWSVALWMLVNWRSRPLFVGTPFNRTMVWNASTAAPVQQVELSEFECLEENDILFIDSSHLLKIGSDVQFLEVLPRLKTGVIVHIHDVFLPANYSRNWVVDDLRFGMSNTSFRLFWRLIERLRFYGLAAT